MVLHGSTAVAELKLHFGPEFQDWLHESSTAPPPWPN